MLKFNGPSKKTKELSSQLGMTEDELRLTFDKIIQCLAHAGNTVDFAKAVANHCYVDGDKNMAVLIGIIAATYLVDTMGGQDE